MFSTTTPFPAPLRFFHFKYFSVSVQIMFPDHFKMTNQPDVPNEIVIKTEETAPIFLFPSLFLSLIYSI